MKRTTIKDIGHLLNEWDWEKNSNDGLFPDQISFGSTKKVWWKCSLDHSWQASPNNRSKGQGCPVCAGRKIQVGYNDLKTQLPELAKEWDSTKNNGLSPEDVTAHSPQARLVEMFRMRPRVENFYIKPCRRKGLSCMRFRKTSKDQNREHYSI